MGDTNKIIMKVGKTSEPILNRVWAFTKTDIINKTITYNKDELNEKFWK